MAVGGYGGGDDGESGDGVSCLGFAYERSVLVEWAEAVEASVDVYAVGVEPGVGRAVGVVHVEGVAELALVFCEGDCGLV